MHTISDMINSDDAVSEVLGYILIFGMVVTMVGLIFIVGIPAIEDAQERAYFESIKRGITVLDSKASMVALGESPAQTIHIDSKGGIFGVNENASNITILMDEEIIVSGSLGTLTYELGDTVIAYEGGGVWMKYPKGDPVMISPPEFHYNGETLTLPIIRLLGNKYTSGTGTVQFNVAKNESEIRFPYTGNPYSNINQNFTNPVVGTKDILITIQSDYYKAWGKYMDERTDVHGITTNDTRREVSATLNIKPTDAAHKLENSLVVYEIDDTVTDPITNFQLDIVASNTAPGLNALDLEFKTSVAINPQLIITLKEEGGASKYTITITYKDDMIGYEEIWKTAPFPGDHFAQDFDLLGVGDMIFENTPSKPSKSWGDNQYVNDAGDFEQNDVYALSNITQHYMSIMPAPFEFEAYVKGTGDKVDLDNSTVVLNYAVAPPRLTYLHIVSHNITVGIS